MNKSNAKIKSFFTAIMFPFLATFILGLTAHFYAMTHNLLTYDSMWNIYSNQNMITSGRQFLMFACGISSFYDLSWVNGILSLLYISLSVALICLTFDIKDKISTVMVAGIIVAFPSVAATFCYSFTVDGYMLALLLSVVSFVLAYKYKWGFLPAVFTLGISLGIYQAYMSVTIVLCVIGLVKDILDNDKIKNVFIKGLKFAFMGLFSYVFYVITLKLMLSLEGMSLSGYQGSDKVMAVSLSSIPAGLKAAFTSSRLFLMYSGVLTQNIFMKIAIVIFAALSIYFVIVRLCAFKGRDLIIRIVCVLALLMVLPFGISYVAIISPDTFYHILLRMSVSMLFVFPFAIYKDIKEKISVKVLACAGAVMAFSFIISANICYFNMNERYEKTYAFCVRLVDRIEQTPGYKQGDEIAILGGLPSSTNYPLTDITGDTLVGFFGVDGDYCVNSADKIAEFSKHYLGVTLNIPDFERQLELVSCDEYNDLEPFPSAKSIGRIDGVWVVRLND